MYYFTFYFMHRKLKVIPVQAWTDREGFWRLRLPDYKTGGT